jgi:hypothetical protein
MQLSPMEITDVKQLASQYRIVSAHVVPFLHDSRTNSDGSAARWYRIVLGMVVGTDEQFVVLSTSRSTLKQFAKIGTALELIETEFAETDFETISVLRDTENDYNVAMKTM